MALAYRGDRKAMELFSPTMDRGAKIFETLGSDRRGQNCPRAREIRWGVSEIEKKGHYGTTIASPKAVQWGKERRYLMIVFMREHLF